MGSGSEGLGCGNDVGDVYPEVGLRVRTRNLEGLPHVYNGAYMCSRVHWYTHTDASPGKVAHAIYS